MNVSRTIRLVSFALSLICIGFGAWVIFNNRPQGGDVQTITITPGTSRLAISRHLQEQGIIRSGNLFFLMAVTTGKVLQAGTYDLDPNETLITVLALITRSQGDRVVLTIPEGWRKEQIALQLDKKGLDGSGFLELAAEKEGYLFPDTYYLDTDATPEEIVGILTANFATRTAGLNLTRDQVILASIVEREAQRDNQRALIAGIFLNRISKTMKLDADPTVQYGKDTNLLAKGTPPERYWQAITLADYTAVISPYNTYLHSGLPPGPIANPGLKSIQAVLHAEPTTALYFFHNADGDIYTARTLEEHNTNKTRYLRKR